MRLIQNWRAVALNSHSMIAQFGAVLALCAPEALFHFRGIDTDPRYWWWLALALSAYGIIGRLIDQGFDRGRARRAWLILIAIALAVGVVIWQAAHIPQAGGDEVAVVAPQTTPAFRSAAPTSEDAFLKAALPLVTKWEGLRTSAYIDPVGVPTVCYGHTKGVKLGQRYSAQQCADMLRAELLEYRTGLHRYFTADTKRARLPPTRDAAYGSLAFNVGIVGAGKSTATRRLNAGNIAGGCEALTWWNKAGGRVMRGLVKRRADERTLCLQGLS